MRGSSCEPAQNTGSSRLTPASTYQRVGATWMHLRSRQGHLLDYVLVQRGDQQVVLVKRRFRVLTDLSPATQETSRQAPPGQINIALLSLPAHHLHFSSELDQRPANLPVAASAAIEENASVGNRWCQLGETVLPTALTVLGRARCLHQGWFDNDATINNLLVKKNHLHKSYGNFPTDDNKAAFYRSLRLVQQRLREMQDTWTARKAEEIQGYMDRNDWKNFFVAMKAVYGPTIKDITPLLSAHGTTPLAEKTQILQRWAEHLRGVLNRPFTISDATVARLPQVEISPAGEHSDQIRFPLSSTRTAVRNSWII
nr:unnamed protein product [Spirometra erinaceieuropaei]